MVILFFSVGFFISTEKNTRHWSLIIPLTYKVKVFDKVYKTSYFEDPLMDFVHVWHDGRYRCKVFIGTIPTPGVTLGSR